MARALLKLRPKLQYLGFDASEYAVRRFGRTRNLHYARFEDFRYLRPCEPADLLVCSDVLHYVPTRELKRGLPGLAELCGGVAFLETFAKEDEFEGDHDGFQPRKALVPAGLQRRGVPVHRQPLLAGAKVGGRCGGTGGRGLSADNLNRPRAATLPLGYAAAQHCAPNRDS